ncbi:hypothetical protein OIE43_02495 [Streptomyces pseudovenezuelae]|uniref:hypothetical protein n=1 Tax=Streptomyces pseudovenezuelae TaxID=67350 RepID=UPI002E34506B|nr:hypothetical protein [Streptomyces pseudovenezuelae]
MKCLNRNGLKGSALPDNSGWAYDGNSTMSRARQNEVDKNCTTEACGNRTH